MEPIIVSKSGVIVTAIDPELSLGRLIYLIKDQYPAVENDDIKIVNKGELLQGNEQKLEQMRMTVDEKLQGTLEQRLGESFKLVSERLEAVQKGLGEMQTLATGVGDLKKVLTNVKSRGGWGEAQLGALLEDFLTPNQYVKNHNVKKSTQELVEYAVKMPGRFDDDEVYLPIDSKFPMDKYEQLVAAQETGGDVEGAAKELERSLRNEAKTISDKYIDPPHSNDR